MSSAETPYRTDGKDLLREFVDKDLVLFERIRRGEAISYNIFGFPPLTAENIEQHEQWYRQFFAPTYPDLLEEQAE